MTNQTTLTEHSVNEQTRLVLCGIVVLSMQCGFALIESGSIRNLNSVNILFKNYSDLVVGAIAWWVCGWGFAFGDDLQSHGVIGGSDFFASENIDFARWFFQLSFATTAATIDSGAVVERMKLSVYTALSFMMTAWTYPVIVHWVWTETGWLQNLGMVDFAGSGVVHLLGGVSALLNTVFLGPRLGFFGRSVPSGCGFEDKHVIATHRVFEGEPSNQVFGTMTLFIGWFGFNCGSALLSTDTEVYFGKVAMNTALGGVFGGAAGSVYSVGRTGFAKAGPCTASMLAGLVSITASAHILPGWAAAMSGSIGAVLGIGTTHLLERFNVDDPVGVVPVHLAAGIWGLLVPGIFSHGVILDGEHSCFFRNSTHNLCGVLFEGGMQLFGVQCLGILTIFCWGAINTILFWTIVQYVLKIRCRVHPIQELVGSDVCEHGVDLISRVKATKDFQRMIATFMQNRLKMQHVARVVPLSFADIDEQDWM